MPTTGPVRADPDDARQRVCAELGFFEGEDDQDRFSQLQQTTLPEGPDSVSFYNAKVKMEQKVTWGIWVSRKARPQGPQYWDTQDGPPHFRGRGGKHQPKEIQSPRVSGYLLPTPEWHTVVVPQTLARRGHGQ